MNGQVKELGHEQLTSAQNVDQRLGRQILWIDSKVKSR
jgi:hypothetical protein